MRKDEVRQQGLPVIDIKTPVETSNRGVEGVSVYVQDQTTPPLSVQFLKERLITTLSTDANIDDRVINLTPGHGVIPGDTIELAKNGESIFMQAGVLSVNVDVITLDQPVNDLYLAASTTAIVANGNMLVDGSVTPQIFTVTPLPSQVGDIVRAIIEITGTSAIDFETFGSDPKLTNGCVLRVKKQDGTFRNLFNFKTNGDFIRQAFDYDMLQAIANSDRSFVSRVTWGGASKHGVVIRLDGALGEEFQLVIQDDLTGGDNTIFNMQLQGHETQ